MSERTICHSSYGDAKASERFFNQGVVLAVAHLRTASSWGKRRRQGVESAEADAVCGENSSAQGKERHIARVGGKEA